MNADIFYTVEKECKRNEEDRCLRVKTEKGELVAYRKLRTYMNLYSYKYQYICVCMIQYHRIALSSLKMSHYFYKVRHTFGIKC